MMTVPPVIQESAYALLAEKIEEAGLRIEDHFRVGDTGFALSKEAAAAIARTGFPMALPSNDTLEGVGIARNADFFHPLSVAMTEKECGMEGGSMNMWGAASVLMKAGMGWMPSNDGGELARTNMANIIAVVSPTTSVSELMKAARYSDPRLMQLVELLHRGLDTLAVEKK